MLDGMFSFVLLDTRDNSFIAARDAIGITSLYIGWGLDGNFFMYHMLENEFTTILYKGISCYSKLYG